MTAPLVRRSPIHTGTVVANAELTPRMRRITVRSEAMRGASIRPAQDVEIFLRDDTGRRVKRRYTIRHLRADSGEIDLDVLLHGSWPGSAWAQNATESDEVEFQGPRGKLELQPSSSHLLIGDESALPAIAAIAESLPPSEPATAFVEVDDADDELPVAASVRWVHREGSAPGGSDLLVAAIADVAPSAVDASAYLMGETRAMVALRAVLEQRGFAHERIFVKGYWNVGRPDRIAGRSPREA